jgi:glycosyltransferase involved in cell wall biosynthesis
MRIAVIEHAGSEDYTEYLFSLIEEAAGKHNHYIKTWSNSIPAFQQQVDSDAIVFIPVETALPYTLKWLYGIKLPSRIKKIRADVVINLNGIASGRIRVPQVIAAGPFLFTREIKKLNIIEKFALQLFDRSSKLADRILIYSDEKTKELKGIKEEKLQVMPFTAPEIFKTFEWHEKIMVKAQHADNKEFFISVIEDNDPESFVMLLQAFSKFKKWQQSSMQLLILPKHESFGDVISAKHRTYKYRDDVRLLEDIEEKQVAAIIASAYAFIHIAKENAHLFILSVAIQCSLPVISFEDNDVSEYAGNAVLFCTEKSAGQLGNSLIQLYKDEDLHAQLKQEAAKRAANLDRQEYADKLWQLLETTVHV